MQQPPSTRDSGSGDGTNVPGQPRDRHGRIDGRIEPSLGAPVQLDRDPGVPPDLPDGDAPLRRATPGRFGRSRQRWPVWMIGVGALVLVFAVVGLRSPLSDWLWPQTQAQQLRAEAGQALREGRLTQSDGRGARELYEAALALEPDRSEARDGLAAVGQGALVQAKVAIDAGRYPDAHAALRLARQLSMPDGQVRAVAESLRRREASGAGIDSLLAMAADARAAGRLDGGADTALPLYLQVLALQPDLQRALEGREDTLADLLQLARQAIDRGDLVEGSRRVGRVREADPGHADLPDVISALAARTERTRVRADADLHRGRLSQALAGYRSLQQVDPDDPEITASIAHVATGYAQRSERAAADFDFDKARAALRDARAIDPDAPEVLVAERHLARASQSQARVEQDAGAGGVVSRAGDLKRLLAEAAAAEKRGDLLDPPGDSMFDKLRAARAVAPRDPRVIAATGRLLPAARGCFDAALRRNRLSDAGDCLEAREVLGDGGEPVQAARRQLSTRWIAVGQERLGAGELGNAEAALRAARALDSNAPGLDDLAERLKAASPGN